MNARHILTSCAVLACSLCATLPALAQTADRLGFSYQGQLLESDARVTGTRDFRITLFDALTAGTAVSNPTILTAAVENGLFTLNVNPGVGVFNGNPRFLQIEVRTNSSQAWTVLGPRQPVLAVPSAQTAAGWFPVAADAVDINNSGFVNVFSGAGFQTQTFTPAVSGELLYIDINFAVTPTVDSGSLCEIFDGGTRIAVGNLLLTPGAGLKRATFDTSRPVMLVAGRTYSLRFFNPFDASPRLTIGNNYAGGAFNNSGTADLSFLTVMRSASSVQNNQAVGVGRAPVAGAALTVAGQTRLSGPVIVGPVAGSPASGGLQVTGASGGLATGNGVFAGVDAGSNSNIELAGGTPYIDFSTTSGLDYQARIILNDPTRLNLAAPAVRITGSFENFSDERAKTDIRPIGDALSLVSALRGVRYHWDPKNPWGVRLSTQEQIGFLAQDVERVLPELVTTGSDGAKSVSYVGLVPVLVEALRETQTRNAKDLAERDGRISDLQQRLERLEKLLPAADK